MTETLLHNERQHSGTSNGREWRNGWFQDKKLRRKVFRIDTSIVSAPTEQNNKQIECELDIQVGTFMQCMGSVVWSMEVFNLIAVSRRWVALTLDSSLFERVQKILHDSAKAIHSNFSQTMIPIPLLTFLFRKALIVTHKRSIQWDTWKRYRNIRPNKNIIWNRNVFLAPENPHDASWVGMNGK